MEIQNYSKTVFLKNGKTLEISIGIHTGPVISGVIGETKPQFSLIGDTVYKTSKICYRTPPTQVSVSKETHHYLELYTNNYMFKPQKVDLRHFGFDTIFTVGILRGKARANLEKNSHAIKNFDGQLNTDGDDNFIKRKILNEFDQQKEHQKPGVLNDTDNSSYEQLSEVDQNSKQGDKEWNNVNYQDDADLMENESNQTDMIDDGTMNVFCFNDDLNLDDRLIIQNATDNQIYNLVERPKYLLSFELKDSEQEFLYTISKQEARKTTSYLSCLILLNKIVIFGDIMQDGSFEITSQFYLMFPILAFELLLVYKLNNPTLEHVHFWTYLLLIYGILVLGVLLSYQAKYLGFWTVAGFNELQIQLTLSLIFMMRNVLLRQFLITYGIYLFTWIVVVVISATTFEYEIIQFILG